MTTTISKKSSQQENNLLKARLDNVANRFLSALGNLPTDKRLELLTLTDDVLWTQVQLQASTQELIGKKSIEKREQEEFAQSRLTFLASLDKFDGIHKTSTVAKILNISVPTVIKKGEDGKLIVINWGVENLYPVFQFSVNQAVSEKGMLAGVPELLSCFKSTLSAVRKCNFFTRQVEYPLSDEKISILQVLRRGATAAELEYFKILAQNFGTQNAL